MKVFPSRFFIALTFCFFCSCAYLGDYIDGTPSLLSKSPETKDNASSEQSKQVEVKERESEPASQSTEITKISPAFDERSLKLVKVPNSEIVEIYPLFLNTNAKSTLLDLLTVSQDGHVLLRKSREKFKNAYKLFKLKPGFSTAAISRRGKFLAVAYPGDVEIIDLATKQSAYSLKRISSRVSSMEFSPDDTGLLLAGVDAAVYRWRFVLEKKARSILEGEQSFERYIGHSAVVNLARYHPFGRVFVSSDWGGAINAWLMFDQDKYQGRYDENIFIGRTFSEEMNRVRGSRKVVSIIEQIRFSDDGQHIYLADEDGTLDIWTTRGFKSVASFAAVHKGKIFDLSIDSVNKRVVTIGRDGILKVSQVVIADSKVPGIKDYTLPMLKMIALREIGIENARKVLYLNSDNVAVTNAEGKVMLVEIKS